MNPRLKNISLKCFFNCGRSDSARHPSIVLKITITRTPITAAPAASCALGTNFFNMLLYFTVFRVIVIDGAYEGLVDPADGAVARGSDDVPWPSSSFGRFLSVKKAPSVDAEVAPVISLWTVVVT